MPSEINPTVLEEFYGIMGEKVVGEGELKVKLPTRTGGSKFTFSKKKKIEQKIVHKGISKPFSSVKANPIWIIFNTSTLHLNV